MKSPIPLLLLLSLAFSLPAHCQQLFFSGDITTPYRFSDAGDTLLLKDSSDNVIGEFARYPGDAILTNDTIVFTGKNLIHWCRSFTLKDGEQPGQVRLTMDFIARHKSNFAMIPGISWNGNPNDPGNVYHGFTHEGTPWSFASHRTLIPGATYTEGNRYSIGMFSDTPFLPAGLSCSLIPQDSTTIHRLIVPEEEQPKRVLIREYGLSAGRANVLRLSPGQSVTISAWLVVSPKRDDRSGYRDMLDVAWNHFYDKTTPRMSKEELWSLAVRYAKESLWDEQAGMFHLALLYDTTKHVWRKDGYFSIGWCGRNGELSNGLLEDFFRTGDSSSLRLALKCLDAWAKRVKLDSLPVDFRRLTDPFSPFQGLAGDANTLSDGATSFLKAYRQSQKAGLKRDSYLRIGLGICNAAKAAQKDDGRFESPGCQRGAIGASLIPPLLTAYEITGEKSYLTSARSALRFYMNILYRDGYLWGGALDTRSIDKESINPLLAGSVRLFELTRDTSYLHMAEDASYYLAAWQITQSIPNPSGSLLDEIAYESFGGTSVATVHMCADNYALATIPYLLRLADYTGKKIWEERAKAIWDYSTQGISRGDMALQGLPARPVGAQDETVNYTDWGYDFQAFGMDRSNPRGAGQFWLVGWAHAYRVTVLSDRGITNHLKDW